MNDSQTLRTMMVDTQVRPSNVTKFPIIEAMLAVPREDFVPDARRAAAYADAPVDLGDGRAMLEPRTLAKILDAVDIGTEDLVLDLGTGLGYGAAVMARMAEFVVALEEDAELAAEAETRLAAAGVDNVAVITGPLAEGDARHGPYDVVFIEGAVQQVPSTILKQIKDGGRIVAIFDGDHLGTVRVGYRIGDDVDWRSAFNAAATVLPGFAAAPEFAL
ncbi:MAG: methyltransferase domain-containing protein [Maritimibacter sp.]|nr:methyltransferase domain-containing protein [Maritimibacter sp.]